MAPLPVTNPSNEPGFCHRNRQVCTEQSKILKSVIFGGFVKGVVQPLDTEKGITKEKSLVHGLMPGTVPMPLSAHKYLC